MKIEVELTHEQAWALAEYLERAWYSDDLRLAVDEYEAWEMRGAGERVRDALAEQGIKPR